MYIFMTLCVRDNCNFFIISKLLFDLILYLKEASQLICVSNFTPRKFSTYSNSFCLIVITGIFFCIF